MALKMKTALVTGGAKRIGRDINLSLASDGYDIALHYNSTKPKIVEEIKEKGVVIIEQKDVGDYTVTVLTADSADALIEWLIQNEYEFDIMARRNFDYYIEKEGFFFIAMKVNMEKAKVDLEGNLRGKLRPIEFKFSIY